MLISRNIDYCYWNSGLIDISMGLVDWAALASILIVVGIAWLIFRPQVSGSVADIANRHHKGGRW